MWAQLIIGLGYCIPQPYGKPTHPIPTFGKALGEDPCMPA